MNDRRVRGNGVGMKRTLLTASFTSALLAPTSARADGDAIRVLVQGPLDSSAVAAAIADELDVATSIVTDDAACVAPCARVTIDAAQVASIHLRGVTGVQVRSIELPASESAAVDIISLVVGNLARDESAALIAALANERDATSAPAPAPAPAPTPEPDPDAAVIAPAQPGATTPAAPTRTPAPDPERARAHGVSLGFIPLLAVDIGASGGFSLDILAGARRRTTGFGIAGVGSYADEVRGTQLAGVIATAGEVRGAQIGGAIVVAREVRGTQAGGAIAISGPMHGAQLSGAVGLADDVDGAQIAGAIAVARAVRGTQIAGGIALAQGYAGTQVAGGLNVAAGDVHRAQVAGGLNVAAGGVHGVQVAPINIAGRVDGVQVGVINVARAGDGESIGLINIVRGGRTELEGTLDDHAVGAVVVRHGGRRWHNVYGVAARAERSLLDEEVTDDDMWMYGLGFGPTLHTGTTTVDVEAMAWQVIYGDDFTHDLDLLAQLRLVLGHRIGPAAVVVGGALNTYVTTDEARQGYGARIVPGTMPPPARDDVRVDIWPSVFAGVRL